jgi:magnesium chelatase accessory protein
MSKPDWALESASWPNAHASRFVTAAELRWHVQVLGAGPALLLLHGSGAATHSWRDLAPLLARRFQVIAPDLPGHGFTETPRAGGMGLPATARRVAALLAALDCAPVALVGHSAGAAIALRMVLDGLAAPQAVVSINGALEPFPGAANVVFPVLAQALFLNPVAVRLFAWRARASGAVERLVSSTGSRLDAAGLALYRRLLVYPGHVEGTLGMMASWDLEPLRRDLPRLRTALLLIAGQRDAAVPPGVAQDVAGRVPGARLALLPRLGHLAHEEAPGEIAQLIFEALGALQAEGGDPHEGEEEAP